MKRISGHLTYANVISTLCLFLLLSGGAAYAATHLAKNSVGTKQLKNGSVTGAKVAKNTLTGANINAPTLGTVPSATNATNASVATAAHSLLHVTIQRADGAPVAKESSGSVEVFCPPGQEAIAGGGRTDQTVADAWLTSSRPGAPGNTKLPETGDNLEGWRISVFNNSSTTSVNPSAFVICAS